MLVIMGMASAFLHVPLARWGINEYRVKEGRHGGVPSLFCSSTRARHTVLYRGTCMSQCTAAACIMIMIIMCLSASSWPRRCSPCLAPSVCRSSRSRRPAVTLNMPELARDMTGGDDSHGDNNLNGRPMRRGVVYYYGSTWTMWPFARQRRERRPTSVSTSARLCTRSRTSWASP